MVKLTKIYTKTGDAGRTRLATGETVAKADPRVEAYGAVDETNAFIGAAIQVVDEPDLAGLLRRIQNDLFDVGADLATPERDKPLGFEALRATPAQTQALERAIDEMNAELQPLESFVLPGGSEAAARLHLARTVCRRAERRLAALASLESETVNPAALTYLNRLSDLLFVAARWVNDRGAKDVLWVPGENR